MRPAVRVTPEAYRRVVLIAGVMLAVIVVSGAAVRLTSSGLGCEDWPTCSADSFAPEWSFHGWVEFGNRLFTGIVSAAVIAAVLAALVREPRDRRLVWLAVGLVVGVLAQILVGAAVVLLELAPISVTAHFLISMALLANAVWLYRAADPHRPAHRSHDQARPAAGERRWSTIVVVLGLAVLVTGTVVTGTGPNSGDVRAERLPFELTAVARIHSLTAWAFLAAAVITAIRLARSGTVGAPMTVVLASSIAQGAIGYAQYATGVPPWLVQIHVTGSIAVWCSAVWLYLWMRDEPFRSPAAQAVLIGSAPS